MNNEETTAAKTVTTAGDVPIPSHAEAHLEGATSWALLPPPTSPPHIDEELLREYGTPEQLEALYGALAAAAGEFGTVEKTAKVGFKNVSYTYAPLANLVNAIRKPLSKQGVFCTQQFTMGKDDVRGTITTIVAAKGARLVSKICFKPENDIKGMGGQVTYLKRYALCGVFMLDGVDDADQFEEKTPSGAGDDKPRAKSSSHRPRSQAPRPDRPLAPASARKAVAARRQASAQEEGPPPPSDADAPQDPMAEPRTEVMDGLKAERKREMEMARAPRGNREVQEMQGTADSIEDVPTPKSTVDPEAICSTVSRKTLRSEVGRTRIKRGVLDKKCQEMFGLDATEVKLQSHAERVLEYLGSIADGAGASL